MNADLYAPPRSMQARGPSHIAIEGPIGVGKTSIATKLAQSLGARVVFEEFADNPFIRQFYEDRARVAFQTQVYFLVARYKQQEALRQHDLFARTLVSDYLFAKDRIFACVNLSEAELSLYDKIFELLAPTLVRPDLVIYLHASLPVLQKRMRLRGRDFEQQVDPKYIETLMQAYNRHFFHYDQTPLLTVDTTDLELLHDERDFERFRARILEGVSGTQSL